MQVLDLRCDHKPYLYLDLNKKEDKRFYKSLLNFFEIATCPSIKIEEIKHRRYRIK